MISLITRTPFQPFRAFALFAKLASRLDALRRRRREVLAIRQLRQLEPHLLKDIGVNERALYATLPTIVSTDGVTLHP
jgi:uncharacterized protein YjiS (DUF1127 family)